VSIKLLPRHIRQAYEVHEWKHACAVLKGDFSEEWNDIIEVLADFRLKKSAVMAPGGGKSPIATALDGAFFAKGWTEKSFETKVVVDKKPIETPTHKVDCFKNRVALEIEWNNKDPFFAF
jgi:hypothetical protein